MIENWKKIHLVCDCCLQHCKSIMSNFFLQGIKYNVKCTFDVGDTTHAVHY